MGRITILATDIFLCLFAVFAALREIVPHYEFLPSSYAAVEIRWPAAAPEHCLIYAETDSGLGRTVLTDPGDTPLAQYDAEGDNCILRRRIEDHELSATFSVLVIIPLLNAAACNQARVIVRTPDPSEQPLPHCADNAAHFTVSY